MLALCLMLLVTCYAQNYVGIIGWSLIISTKLTGCAHLRLAASQPLLIVAYRYEGCAPEKEAQILKKLE